MANDVEMKNDYVKLDAVLMSFPPQFNRFMDFIFGYLKTDIPRIYIGIMMVLQNNGPMPISHIGEKLGIAKPNMTPLIKGLIKQGMVDKSPSVKDKRITFIELTRKGEGFISEIISELDFIIREKFSVLSREEAGEFIKSLNTLLALGNKVVQENK